MIYPSFTDHYCHRTYGRLLNDGLLDEVHHCLRDASIRDAGKRLSFIASNTSQYNVKWLTFLIKFWCKLAIDAISIYSPRLLWKKLSFYSVLVVFMLSAELFRSCLAVRRLITLGVAVSIADRCSFVRKPNRSYAKPWFLAIRITWNMFWKTHWTCSIGKLICDTL